MKRKLIGFILSVVVLLSAFPFSSITAYAISCRKDGFDKSRYSLTGNMAADVVTVAKSQKGRTGAQFGYTEAWCDEFVADCLENAGADSSIVGHGGTVADFESVMRNKGAVTVSSPQPGDLCFMTWSHVEIVTKVENCVVYCAGGNNGGTGNYKTNYCAGERSFSNSQIRLFLRPNYSKDPPPNLVTPTIYTDKSSYTVGDTVNISWEASPAGSNLSHYWLNIAGPNGEYPYSGTMNLNTSYSFVASQAGNYTITTYATPKGSLNGEGSLTDTKTISVENKPIILNASVTSLDLKQNERKTITISCANYPDNIYLKYECDNDSILKCTWGDWSGDTVPLTIEGKNAGTEIITVTMRDSNSNNVLATIKVNVSIKSNQCYVQLYDGNRLLADYSLPYGFELNDFYLPNLEKDGFTFVGWYTAGGTEYSIGSKVPEIPELSLYARCKENKCIVKWDPNIEGFPCTYTEYKWGEKFGNAAENIDAEPSGSFFEGWYMSGNPVTRDTLVPEKNEITLYAHWRMEDLYLYATTIELTLDELIASDYKVKVPIVIRGTSGSNIQGSIGWNELGYGASWNTEELTALNVGIGDAIRNAVDNDKNLIVSMGKAINNDEGLMWSGIATASAASSGEYIKDGTVSYITFDVNPSASAGDIYKGHL